MEKRKTPKKQKRMTKTVEKYYRIKRKHNKISLNENFAELSFYIFD